MRSWPRASVNAFENNSVFNEHSYQPKKELLYRKTSFWVVVIIGGVLTTAYTVLIWYLVHGMPISYIGEGSTNDDHNFTIYFQRKMKLMQNELLFLQNQYYLLKNRTSREMGCDELQESCDQNRDSEEQINNQEMESYFNRSEKEIQIKMKASITEVNAIDKQRQNLNCSLKKRIKSGNVISLAVVIPKSSQDGDTLSLTCSTTREHTADVSQLITSTRDQSPSFYKCVCKNKISKYIDCVAFFWQCKSI
ncbi:uncharacterized protein LOC124442817 [Xenia sp. Carnegie-2017]|uniref:uncharacterized protein LOC124442817 n=1 Tax=Xenia sp. Carnegie-2017 TaxID=2897299 RepID=UPI001F0342F5|nr:uncharacterized protein LOC124442817 [Xenia sp. Carnegie-2017]